MRMPSSVRIGMISAVVGLFPGLAVAQGLDPIVYTVKSPAPETHVAEVEVTVPTGGGPTIEMMMPIWSPGFYRVEDYSGRVQGLTAKTPDGAVVGVEQPQKNRWRIQTGGKPKVVVSYRLACEQRSVTTNWVGADFAVFNGAATFLTLAEQARRPHEVRIELPAQWKRSITALGPAPDGMPDHYRAEDYDTLVDSPIIAGNLDLHEFEVAGSRHILADVGELGQWDGGKVAQDLEKIVRENRRFWGFLPFKRYVFLNVFRRGGGGLEHKDSTLLTSSPARAPAGRNLGWLEFVSHEYFHAFNVKRLRPIELGPFDYEVPPKTSSLWISEGLTSYYGELLVARAGIGSRDEFLASESSHIAQLQNSPGRLAQTLDQASLEVWDAGGTSGVGVDKATKISYYVKGPVVGFLLDAKIRKVTDGKKSLDDAMRLAYARYGGDRGFTADQFRQTVEEAAGVDLAEWFRKALATTEELDYQEALDWFGLRFAPSEDKAKAWKLEIRQDATEAQKAHLGALFG